MIYSVKSTLKILLLVCALAVPAGAGGFSFDSPSAGLFTGPLPDVPRAARAPAGAHVRDFRTLYGALGYPSRDYFGSTADEVTDLAAYTGQEDPIYQEINGYLRFYPAPYEWYGTSPAQ